MKQYSIQTLPIVLMSILFFLFGCDNKEEFSKDNSFNAFDLPAFIRLADDSTNVAGILKFPATGHNLDLTWNIPAGCNVDTSQTVVMSKSGMCQIPIKWSEHNEVGTYGPKTKAFDGGVLVSDGNISRYVHLIWADKVDSVKYSKEACVQTRSDGALLNDIVLEVTPEVVNMDKVVGGGIYVNFSGISIISVDQSNIAETTNIIKDDIPMFMTEAGFIYLKWKDGKAPDSNFSTMINFTAGNIVKTVFINYVPPYDEPTVWEFLNSSPIDGGTLAAIDATVVVNVKTNKLWSLECTDGLVSPVTDTTTGIGNKTQTMHISNNPRSTPRIITVLVKSEGVLKKTLTFSQLGNNSGGGDTGTTFTFISSNPVDNTTLPSTESSLTVKVNTDYAWWIELDGIRTNLPAGALGEKTGTIAIPANTGTTNKTITVTVGHGTMTEKTLTFTQSGSGGGDTQTLTYVSSSLPTGNIPATATAYTFNFEGGYTGQFRVRSLDATTGTVLFNGPIGTTHSPKVTVPANTATTTRNIKFQYRLIDIAGSLWEDLPASTNRIQDGGTVSEDIKASETLSPGGKIPEEGGTYTCTFTGGSGNVILRAMKKRVNSSTWTEAARSASTAVPGDVAVTVPILDGLNSTISFEYSIDGGNTWKTIRDNREQVNTWILIDYPSHDTVVAATNGSLSFGLRGNIKQPITIYVKYEGREIGRATGYAPSTLVVPIEDNPSSSPRYISYSHKTIDGEGWVGDVLMQAGK